MKIVLEQHQPMAPSGMDMALTKRLSAAYKWIRLSPARREALNRADSTWEQQKHTGRLLSSWDR